MSFEVGYHDLHPDRSLNFQLNRWITYLGPAVVPELTALARRVDDYDDWIREFLALSEAAEREGRTLAAGLYARSSEFFVTIEDPRKPPTRRRFLRLVQEVYAELADVRVDVPYPGGFLPSYRLTPSDPRSTLVVFGGFDSYIEEFFPILVALRDAGYDVVAFEGPGQGAALEEAHLPMTVQWQLPVAAVLDHFHLSDVTLVGVSLGGALALASCTPLPVHDPGCVVPGPPGRARAGRGRRPLRPPAARGPAARGPHRCPLGDRPAVHPCGVGAEPLPGGQPRARHRRDHAVGRADGGSAEPRSPVGAGVTAARPAPGRT